MDGKLDRQDLGFDNWFADRFPGEAAPDCLVARVTEVNRDSFVVRTETSEVFAEATGRLLYNAESPADLPCVGDWVAVQMFNQDELAIIHAVYPRRSWLRRKAAGRKIEYQMIATNIDTAFIVQACGPDFNLRRLERYMAMVFEGNIEPVVLLTKTDLLSPEELARNVTDMQAAGVRCPVFPLSNVSGEGHEQFRSSLQARRTYCLIGSSGVGKSTLLNHVLGKTLFETREIREQDGRGRHATTRRQLVRLPGGALIIDTPGMRELGAIGVGPGIELSFSDLSERAKSCRFSNCTHTGEVGCAVLEALKQGELDEEQYRNYLKLVRESAFNQMSYAERRQKDKRFGKMIKSTLKILKKN